MKKIKNKKGFTLIELIVVIAILAILAAILIPAITGYIDAANKARDQANARSIYSEVALQVAKEETPAPSDDRCTITDSDLSTFSCAFDSGTYTSANNFQLPE